MNFITRKFKSLIVWSLMNIKPLNKMFSDETYLKILYRLYFGFPLDLDNPKRFTEKIQWLKLYNKSAECTMMADKLSVKQYISNTLGKQYVIPLLGVYEHFDDIDFDKLPKQFVLKTTHDSGGPVICKDKSKFDIEEAKKKLSGRLKTNYFYRGREYPYKNIPPCIIAEQYMEDEYGELRDYKLFCFEGKVRMFKIDVNRYSGGKKRHFANYYDNNCNLLPLGESHFIPDATTDVHMPDNIHEMIQLAQVIATGFPFVRVDFYNVKGRVLFGEITFHPAGGFDRIVPDEWDYILGNWINIPSF